MVSDELVKAVSNEIAKAEGFFVTGSVPARAHNPGDLTDDGDIGLGTIRTGGPNGALITIYATDDDGWNALFRKVRRALEGKSRVYTLDMTLAEVAVKWSGDPHWGMNVAGGLGVEASTTLLDLVMADQVRQAGGPIDA